MPMSLDMHPRFAEKALAPRYTFPEAGAILGQPAQKLRRWSLGHDRTYQGVPQRDEPLIQIDGSPDPDGPPLSFLNLIELRFLGSYRAGASLPAIRRALDYAAELLNLSRPLLQQEFAVHGKDLFMEYAAKGEEPYFVNASRGGQLAWTPNLDFFLQSLEYDQEEHAAYQWWPLGKSRPVVVDTRLNGGRPSTASSGLRADVISFRLAQGWDVQSLAEDLAAQPEEIAAVIEFAEAA
jgi:uncharacterized protein (DUF433 family)